MEWLNYHHLRYFWTVAREGSLANAAAKLNVSQPSISEQMRELEEAVGEKLFIREGRKNKLTDTGRVVLGYAEEIFALGSEMMNAVKQRPGLKTLRFYVGVADSVPKLVTNDILRPVFSMPQTVHVICREGKLDDLLVQLAGHRLDLVLADEPASSSVDFKSFNQLLSESGTTFCAPKVLATRLKRTFPQSLHEAPALLPSENTPFRRALEAYFRDQQIKPRVIAECDDLALIKVMAAEGRGFIAIPSIAMRNAHAQYGFQVIGETGRCQTQYYAISAERRIVHPAATLIAGGHRNNTPKTERR
ncbi:MAG: LysR family transcriptional regulator [Limisphaerales bacterium]